MSGIYKSSIALINKLALRSKDFFNVNSKDCNVVRILHLVT